MKIRIFFLKKDQEIKEFLVKKSEGKKFRKNLKIFRLVKQSLRGLFKNTL